MAVLVSGALIRSGVMHFDPKKNRDLLLKFILPILVDFGLVIASITVASLTIQGKMFTSVKTAAATGFFTAAVALSALEIGIARWVGPPKIIESPRLIDPRFSVEPGKLQYLVKIEAYGSTGDEVRDHYVVTPPRGEVRYGLLTSSVYGFMYDIHYINLNKEEGEVSSVADFSFSGTSISVGEGAFDRANHVLAGYFVTPFKVLESCAVRELASGEEIDLYKLPCVKRDSI